MSRSENIWQFCFTDTVSRIPKDQTPPPLFFPAVTRELNNLAISSVLIRAFVLITLSLLGQLSYHFYCCNTFTFGRAAMVRKTLGQYSSLSPSPTHLSHTRNITLSRKKCERYIFIKKCVRSFIEVVIIVDYVAIQHCCLFQDKSTTTRSDNNDKNAR